LCRARQNSTTGPRASLTPYEDFSLPHNFLERHQENQLGKRGLCFELHTELIQAETARRIGAEEAGSGAVTAFHKEEHAVWACRWGAAFGPGKKFCMEFAGVYAS